jgi:hypothetical protein
MGGTYSTHGRRKNAYKFVVGESKEKILLGCPRGRWKENTLAVRMNLRELWRDSLN